MTADEKRKLRIKALKKELKILRTLDTQVYCYFNAKSTLMSSREIQRTLRKALKIRKRCEKMLADVGMTYS